MKKISKLGLPYLFIYYLLIYLFCCCLDLLDHQSLVLRGYLKYTAYSEYPNANSGELSFNNK